MKIAMTHVDLPNQSKGGVASQAHKMANALVRRGHEVTMFSLSPRYDESLYEVHQYKANPLPFQFSNPFWFAFCLARTDFDEFDLVHLHGDNFLLWNQHPQVRTFNGSAKDEARSAIRLRRKLYQGLISVIEEFSAGIADINIGISRNTGQQIPKISKVIPCGVDLSTFYPGEKADVPVVLFVGTAEGRKRGQFLADAFTRDVRSKVPNAELWAVTDAPLTGEGIVNLGRVSQADLCDYFRQAWAFCLPSTYEGFGVPYIEAMASGTAVVATENPGAMEVLDDGAYGLIASDSKLGGILANLLMDEEIRKSYELKGLSRSQNYGWDNVVVEYEKVYLELLKTRQSQVGLVEASFLK